jgi:hypothetical protein
MGLFSLFQQLLQFGIGFAEEDSEGGVGEAVQLGAHRIEAFGLPEKGQKTVRFPVSPVNLEHLVKNDGPGNHGEIKEHKKNKLDDDSGAGKKGQGSYLLIIWVGLAVLDGNPLHMPPVQASQQI